MNDNTCICIIKLKYAFERTFTYAIAIVRLQSYQVSGDPQGRPEEVYNCRCTEVAHIAGLDKDFSGTSWRPSQLLQTISYDEWKAGHKERQEESASNSNQSRKNNYNQKTGNMSAQEYAEYCRELESVKNRKQIFLPKKEYARVMGELNTNLSSEDRKHALITKCIGDYAYIFINKGFNDYTIIGRRKLK